MDELRRQTATLIESWQRLPRSQRLALSVVLISSVVGFSFIIGRSTGSDWQPICDGRSFASKDLAAIQAAWRQQGLQNFRKNGSQLSVPKSELGRYEAALPPSKTESPADGSEWDKQLAHTNLFTSHEQLEQLKDNRLRNELRRVIRAIPAIADADVIWARSKARSSFSNRPKVTATVNVTPRDGHDLTPELAQSLRTAVASMVPDLSPQDVVVLDQSSGLAITGESSAAITRQQHRRQTERLAKQLETKLASALSHISGVSVKVTPTGPATLPETPQPTGKHFVAKPVQDSQSSGSTANEPRALRTPSLCTDDALHDDISLVTQLDQQPRWQVTVTVPQSQLELRAAQRRLHDDDMPELSHDAECARLRQLVTSLLPVEASTAEVNVVPQPATISHGDHASTPQTAAAGSTFLTWPFAACALLGVVVVTSIVRPLRRVGQPIPRAEPPTISSAIDAPKSANSEPADSEAAPQTGFVPPIPAADVGDADSDVLSLLLKADPRQLADALQHERPQAIAVLLTRFTSRLASETLAGLPTAVQLDVIRRLKSLGEVPTDLVHEIARTVHDRLLATEPAASRLVPEHNEPFTPTNRVTHALMAPPKPRAFA